MFACIRSLFLFSYGTNGPSAILKRQCSAYKDYTFQELMLLYDPSLQVSVCVAGVRASLVMLRALSCGWFAGCGGC